MKSFIEPKNEFSNDKNTICDIPDAQKSKFLN